MKRSTIKSSFETTSNSFPASQVANLNQSTSGVNLATTKPNISSSKTSSSSSRFIQSEPHSSQSATVISRQRSCPNRGRKKSFLSSCYSTPTNWKFKTKERLNPQTGEIFQKKLDTLSSSNKENKKGPRSNSDCSSLTEFSGMSLTECDGLRDDAPKIVSGAGKAPDYIEGLSSGPDQDDNESVSNVVQTDLTMPTTAKTSEAATYSARSKSTPRIKFDHQVLVFNILHDQDRPCKPRRDRRMGNTNRQSHIYSTFQRLGGHKRDRNTGSLTFIPAQASSECIGKTN